MRVRRSDPEAPKGPGLDLGLLNEAQRQAVLHRGSPLLILAGAGSGKTRVITWRIARLISDDGEPPGSILAVTFTNKAAREMRERVEALLGPRAREVTIGTFHAVCAALLRRNAGLAGLTSRFSIYDEGDAAQVLKRASESLRLGWDSAALRTAGAAIGAAKHKGLDAEAYTGAARGRAEEEIAALYVAYEAEMRRVNACDFADLVMRAVQVVARNEEVRNRLHASWRHVLVDEFQDTDGVQFDLVRQLRGPRTEVVVVGDDDQSIYGWRGATVANVRRFTTEFAPVRVIALEENYRSGQEILAVASRVVERLPDRMEKTLRAARTHRCEVRLTVSHDDRQEADVVCRQLERWRATRGWRWSDMAVLCRTNVQMRPFEEVLRSRGIGYAVVGGTSFFERAEVKDAMAWLRIAVNERDTVALGRVCGFPARGIGETSLRRFEAFRRERPALSLAEALRQAADQGVVSRRSSEEVRSLARTMEELVQLGRDGGASVVLDFALASCGFEAALREKEDGEDRLGQVAELRAMAAEFDRVNPGLGAAGFVERTVLREATDALEGSDDRVALMTVHAAKGLEFEGVVVGGLEEGLFPLRRREGTERSDDGDEGEERRLFYVATTRAREDLLLSASMTRRLYGQTREAVASPYLLEVRDLVRQGPDSAVHDIPWRRHYEAARRQVADLFDQRPGWADDTGSPAALPGKAPRGGAQVPDEGLVFGAEFGSEPDEAPVQAAPRPATAPDSGWLRVRVRHNTFGDGEVVAVEETGPKPRLSVMFDSGARRSVVSSYLTRVGTLRR
jgi:DNA helicase-2/ATP-dependent DNA helicase PcrA